MIYLILSYRHQGHHYFTHCGDKLKWDDWLEVIVGQHGSVFVPDCIAPITDKVESGTVVTVFQNVPDELLLEFT